MTRKWRFVIVSQIFKLFDRIKNENKEEDKMSLRILCNELLNESQINVCNDDLTPCDSSSVACCIFKEGCGCSDIDAFEKAGYGDADDCIATCTDCSATDTTTASDTTTRSQASAQSTP